MLVISRRSTQGRDGAGSDPDAGGIGHGTRLGQGHLDPLHPSVVQHQGGHLLGHGFDQLHDLALGVITDLAGEGGVIQRQVDIVVLRRRGGCQTPSRDRNRASGECLLPLIDPYGGQNLESANKHLVHDSTSSLLLMGCENSAGMQAWQADGRWRPVSRTRVRASSRPENVARIIPHSYRGKTTKMTALTILMIILAYLGGFAVQCRAGFPHHGVAGSPRPWLPQPGRPMCCASAAGWPR